MDGIVLKKETSKLLKVWIGNELKPNVPFYARQFVKPVIGIVIGLINKYGDMIIPDKVDDYINITIISVKNGNYNIASKAIGDAMVLLVNTKPSRLKEKFFLNVGKTLISGIEYVSELIKERNHENDS